MNLPSRVDNLEGHSYVNGIKDKDGNYVIPPCDQAARDWLDKFEAETVVTDFYHTDRLQKAKKTLDKKIKEHAKTFSGKELDGLKILEQEVINIEDSDLRKRLYGMISRRIKKYEKGVLSEKDKGLIQLFLAKYKPSKAILTASEALDRIRQEDNLYPDTEDQLELYNENNARWNDLYTQAKTNRVLDDFDVNKYDEHTRESVGYIDGESVLIEQIEGNLFEKFQRNILEQEKSIFVDNVERIYKWRLEQQKLQKE